MTDIKINQCSNCAYTPYDSERCKQRQSAIEVDNSTRLTSLATCYKPGFGALNEAFSKMGDAFRKAGAQIKRDLIDKGLLVEADTDEPDDEERVDEEGDYPPEGLREQINAQVWDQEHGLNTEFNSTKIWIEETYKKLGVPEGDLVSLSRRIDELQQEAREGRQYKRVLDWSATLKETSFEMIAGYLKAKGWKSHEAIKGRWVLGKCDIDLCHKDLVFQYLAWLEGRAKEHILAEVLYIAELRESLPSMAPMGNLFDADEYFGKKLCVYGGEESMDCAECGAENAVVNPPALTTCQSCGARWLAEGEE